MQIFKTKDYKQNRAAGRVDYQLIYIYKGAGHYYIHGKWKSLSAGNVLLFRPKEAQTYSYFFKEHPEIYWIHFTGYNCEKIIQKYNLHNCYIGELRQYFLLSILEHLDLMQLTIFLRRMHGILEMHLLGPIITI